MTQSLGDLCEGFNNIKCFLSFFSELEAAGEIQRIPGRKVIVSYLFLQFRLSSAPRAYGSAWNEI